MNPGTPGTERREKEPTRRMFGLDIHETRNITDNTMQQYLTNSRFSLCHNHQLQKPRN